MNNKLLKTGIEGLDEILGGGLISERFYLVRGGPGTGKTTLGLHFLLEGLKNNDKLLFVSMTEDIEKIKENARNFGFPVNKINFLDLSPGSDFISENKDYNLFSSSQMEQKPIIDKLTNKIKEVEPERIFFDGFTQLKYLSSDNFKFRKQILSLVQFVKKYNSTILLTSEVGEKNTDDDLQFIVDGIINMKYKNQEHSLKIKKYRGASFNKGNHPFKFKEDGIKVYPKLVSSDCKHIYNGEQISSGISEIDRLLYGGIEKGTSTIITGPSGAGKTTLGTQFVEKSVENGLKSIIYTFEESYKTLLERSKSINIPLDKMEESGNLLIKRVSPLEYSPQEFSYRVRKDVEKYDISIVLLDSISGYFLSFRNFHEEHNMIRGLHALCEFLKNNGITVFMINEIKNITGDFQATDSNTSYLADNIVFLRFLEVNGKLEKSIGVLKKRMSNFENKMRKFEITSKGIKVGKPLTKMRGILSGNPEFIGSDVEVE